MSCIYDMSPCTMYCAVTDNTPPQKAMSNIRLLCLHVNSFGKKEVYLSICWIQFLNFFYLSLVSTDTF